MSWSRARKEAPGLGAALLVPRGWKQRCSKPGSRGDPTAQPGTLGKPEGGQAVGLRWEGAGQTAARRPQQRPVQGLLPSGAPACYVHPDPSEQP